MEQNQQNQQNTSLGTFGDNQTQNDLSALADSAKAKLGEVAEPVKEKAIEVAQQQKDAGADQVGHFARAMHGAASALEQEMPQFADYVHDAGQKLESLANDLRSGSVDELMDKFGQYAKDQPALVFGGAMVAGFALTRFLKSSASHPHNMNMGQGGTA
jgi:hypothetical protein